MSANCSNASSLSVVPGPFGNVQTILQECFRSARGRFSLASYIVTNVAVFIPLYSYIQYLGLRRWRRQQSAAPTSHSDAFTYHMVIMEQLSLFGTILIVCGIDASDLNVLAVGHHLCLLNTTGENALHLMTCLERYVAVTYPIAYLAARNGKWIRFRNATIVCAWLLSFSSVGIFYMVTSDTGIVIYLSVTGAILGVVFYCSFSVLRVLIRPRPVDGGGHRQRVDQSKLRAFYTITLVLVALVLRSLSFTVVPVLLVVQQVIRISSCPLIIASIWLYLPSNLVLPLLYLQRAGKLPGFKRSTESG